MPVPLSIVWDFEPANTRQFSYSLTTSWGPVPVPHTTDLFCLDNVLVDDSAIALMPHLLAGHTVRQLTLTTSSLAPSTGGGGSRLLS